MTRPRVAVRLSTLLLILIPVACGMRGPPRPPLVILPARVAELSAERFGDEVYIELTIPDTTSDTSEPVDLARVEVYALTTQPSEDQPRLDLEDWLELATLVGSVEVLPADPVEAAHVTTTEGTGESVRRYEPGDDVTLVEILTPELLVPVELADDRDDSDDADADLEEAAAPGPLLAPPLPQPPRRTYVARGISSRGREGRPSPRVPVALGPAPDPPGAPTMTYTAESISLEWLPPESARLSIQADETALTLRSRPILPPQVASRYEVYDLSEPVPEEDEDEESNTDSDVESEEADTAREDGEQEEEEPGIKMPEAVHSAPLRGTSYTGAVRRLGIERCFAVRTVDVVDPIDDLLVRSPPSETACVMLVDTFPPRPPTGVVAVAAGGAINLTWAAGRRGDVVGYILLRGDATGETLTPLLDEPLTVTTYRDADVEPGQTYTYAVQAIDDATPPNVSAPSARVVEQAR